MQGGSCNLKRNTAAQASSFMVQPIPEASLRSPLYARLFAFLELHPFLRGLGPSINPCSERDLFSAFWFKLYENSIHLPPSKEIISMETCSFPSCEPLLSSLSSPSLAQNSSHSGLVVSQWMEEPIPKVKTIFLNAFCILEQKFFAPQPISSPHHSQQKNNQNQLHGWSPTAPLKDLGN